MLSRPVGRQEEDEDVTTLDTAGARALESCLSGAAGARGLTSSVDRFVEFIITCHSEGPNLHLRLRIGVLMFVHEYVASLCRAFAVLYSKFPQLPVDSSFLVFQSDPFKFGQPSESRCSMSSWVGRRMTSCWSLSQAQAGKPVPTELLRRRAGFGMRAFWEILNRLVSVKPLVAVISDFRLKLKPARVSICLLFRQGRCFDDCFGREVRVDRRFTELSCPMSPTECTWPALHPFCYFPKIPARIVQVLRQTAGEVVREGPSCES